MNRDRIKTITNREIKKSFKRFLSLLVMSLLGVEVFVGLKMASFDMIKSLDTYYDDSNSYDIKIVSTLGMTDDDIKKLRNVSSVKDVYGSFSKDVLINNGDTDLVIKVIGITSNINEIDIIKGRMPTSTNELVVEEYYFNEQNLKINDTLTFLDNDFLENELTIVGVVKSPLFITAKSPRSDRGSTNLGTGKVNYYVYVLNDVFDNDYYTESYITLKGATDEITNSNNYKKIVNTALENINRIKKSQEVNRYNEIYNKISDEIRKNELEYLNKFNEAEIELSKANNELINGKIILDSSKAKLDNALIKLSNTKNELDLAKEELDSNEEKLNIVKEKIDDNEKKLLLARNELDSYKEKINDELSKYDLTLEDIYKYKDFIDNIDIDNIKDGLDKDSLYYDELVFILDKIDELDILNKDINIKEELINLIPEDISNYEEIVDFINNITIDNIINNIPVDIPYYDEIINFINNYNKIKEFINIIEKIEIKEKEYNENLLIFNNYKEEYYSKLNLFNDYKEQYKKGYNSYLVYYNEYEKGMMEYNNSLKLYESNYNLYNTKVEQYYSSRKMFELELENAKKELDNINGSKWYVYDRLDNSEYSGFIDDSKSISNLAKIFPTIFFAVAILISLVSMSRMVEEDRMEIGTLKSLGFSNRHIRKKYLFYSFCATLTGGVIGAIVGFALLPLYIWNIYKLLYDIPVFSYDFNPFYTIIGLAIAIICICGVTILTIRKVVKEKPSELLRPKAPINGKRILLERIKIVWNNINFSSKIMFRNLFRYKKRALITIIGIMGCTSVMLVGFGIRDSVINIPKIQFFNVFKFDEMVYLTDQIDDELIKYKEINSFVNTYMSSVNINSYQANLMVFEDSDSISDILNLRDKKTTLELELLDNEVIISDKLSDLINKKVNDKIIIKTTDNKEYEFKISGICENYVGHYIFMNKNTYENNINNFKVNVSYLKLNNLNKEEQLSKKLLKNDNVMTIMSINSTIEGVNNSLSSLNSVVIILILLSAALSFVVLFNLANINIGERKREIATLKVLGFNNKEVDNYITREMNILTIIGIVLGLVLGTFLTYVIVDTVEIEMVRFLRQVNIESYIITILLIIIFTLIVNKIIHYLLKKIDMIESLKSVE